ncbi:MAG: hypothetical protein K6U04_14810 [Armatimonadetes bacterium]|nr:hypothetical protein [Armatimonadota bacterium]
MMVRWKSVFLVLERPMPCLTSCSRHQAPFLPLTVHAGPLTSSPKPKSPRAGQSFF